jgi:wyosine [tRNA(Phe)-imidazoG37] synthetase (radical SAM superfamily)
MKKEKNTYKYIFGPVPSRRLGFSLGIDVVPFKTCSYDCIYCQLGKTTHKTTERKEFVPLKDIISELKLKLKQNIRIDYITLSGSGEPTLYSRLGELISEIKQATGKPLAVLTNGSLLWQDEVRESVRNADLVIPSLDAGTENMFRYVNRPCKDIGFDKVVGGLVVFAANFKGKIWLEVFLLNGVTAIRSEVLRINTIAKKIKPHKIQLNTVKRPPAESFAFTVPEDLLRDAAQYFDGDVEIIADFDRPSGKAFFGAVKAEIVNHLKRRPCSLDDICGGLHLHKNEVLKYVEHLLQKGEITHYELNGTHFYAMRQLPALE